MTTVTHEQIRARAQEIYEFFQQLGSNLIFDKGQVRERNAQDDWLQAERELLPDMRSPYIGQR